MLCMQKCNVMYMKYKCVKDITHYIHRFKKKKYVLAHFAPQTKYKIVMRNEVKY